MDAAYVSALSALAGSAIGAMASFATTWLTQRNQERATLLVQDRARREALYGEFIREASTLFGDAFQHALDDPAKLVNLYAIVNKIRLFGEPETLEEAERVMQRIGETYFAPNKDLSTYADIQHAGDLDPLCAFSTVCRRELAIARR
ncbi:hypothetical protein ABZT49_21940 [Methylobacterium sp. EM32]|uniref:hypothetical protein n=1 Tax=Methylobacterium sp. EM32 TaxID=3163481 RepID=UPI0033B24E79